MEAGPAVEVEHEIAAVPEGEVAVVLVPGAAVEAHVGEVVLEEAAAEVCRETSWMEGPCTGHHPLKIRPAGTVGREEPLAAWAAGDDFEVQVAGFEVVVACL